MDQNDGNLGGQPDIAADIDSILSGGTSQNDPTPGSALAPQQQGQQNQGYKFGGRSYQSQQEAEKAHNQLYGKYSEQQQLFNKLKSALKDPEAYRQFAQNPEWRDILGKLGVEEAEAEYEEAQAQESGGPAIQNLPPQLQEAYRQIQIDRETFKLDREEAGFEKKLGRPVSAEEHNAVMSIIAKADSLTYEQAFKLAFHDKPVKEAAAMANR